MRISWKLVALSAAVGAAGAALVIFLLHLVVGIGNVGDAAFIGGVVGACLQVPRLRHRDRADSRESQEPQPRSWWGLCAVLDQTDPLQPLPFLTTNALKAVVRPW